MKAEYINPFIAATADVMKQTARLEIKRGQLGLKKILVPSYEIAIRIDVVGDVSGTVVYSMAEDVAKRIASAMMMGMPVSEFDDLARSAVNEMANMITGNAASKLSVLGVSIDITPPKLDINGKKKVPVVKLPSLVVPIFVNPHGTVEINISFKEAQKFL